MIKLPKDKSKIVRNLGKKYVYVPYLERALATFDEPWQFTYQEKEKDTHWHPSGHCVPPATELYAIVSGEVKEEPISGSLRKIFQVGHFWHQYLQHVTLHKMEMCKPEAVERKGKREWGKTPFHAVSGSGDLAPLEAPNWTGLVDYKTMNAANFKQQGIPPRYDAKYECQINVYMDLFDTAEAIILPINKDTGEFKEFLYAKNCDLIDMIYQKWEFVSACLDAGEAPTAADDKMFPIQTLLTGPIST